MASPTPNQDENLVTGPHPFAGNFHKTLPHNRFGEVDVAAYRRFERTCVAIEAGAPINFESVAEGPVAPSSPDVPQTAFKISSGDTPAIQELGMAAAKLTSPLAGAAAEGFGPDPKTLEMPPAPSIQSISATAEMVELYWMALLRDAPLVAFQFDRTAPEGGYADVGGHDGELGYGVASRIGTARQAVNRCFDAAVRLDSDPGRLCTPLDLAPGGGGARIDLHTLFRSGLPGEDAGPLLSQFFLQNVGYGTQTIDQSQVPYIAKRDFLVTHGDWLLAQNTGKDAYGRDYGNGNNYGDQLHRGASYYPPGNGRRLISTMRDLARFVNRDALHQAYFNAALFLLNIDAPVDGGNPYGGNRFSREGAFASLGGPDLLTVVSEVASRALKVVWRQKWLVHRRCRPEVFGGLLQMERNGYEGCLRDYGLQTSVPTVPDFQAAVDDTLAAVSAHNASLAGGAATFFLPMAFSAGSPSHPAYGAGHATVAGACVTVLKAWFDEDARLCDIYATANARAGAQRVGPKDPPDSPDPNPRLQLLQPGYRRTGTDLEAFGPPMPYPPAASSDAERITVGGELNKLASNVAMGRSMGGVHWRSDNTRSLRLGEEVAIEILRKRSAEYAERPLSFRFRSFDGKPVQIVQGVVLRD
ncbi:hypothetical protein VB737_04790 [Synechococcus sp. BA-120 BA3]|nr:hypothetical protein [Synechococcus sp. BA-120 BA3]